MKNDNESNVIFHRFSSPLSPASKIVLDRILKEKLAKNFSISQEGERFEHNITRLNENVVL